MSGPCTGPTGTRSGSTGKPGLLLILNSPSGYGPLSTPCLDVDKQTAHLILSFTAENYLASFQAKVQTIRDDTAGSPPPTFPSTTCSLSAVTAIPPAELRHIIIAAAPKSCELDPLPTFLLQEHLLLPLLTTICNRPILEAVFPPVQKRSILISVIKREGLDPTDPGNFRPIANVSFISKIVEKIIAYQLLPYLEANSLNSVYQYSLDSVRNILLRLFYFDSSRTFMGPSTVLNSLCWHFSMLAQHSTLWIMEYYWSDCEYLWV